MGLGRLGSQYARYISTRLHGARLHAVADIRPDVAKAVAAETGAAKTYTDHVEMFADKSVDAVVVMTPSKQHGQVVIAAAKAKKAIFCEKPLTLDLDEGALIEATVAKCHAFFQLGLMRRFDNAYVAAKRRIEGGADRQPHPLQGDVEGPAAAAGRVSAPRQQRRNFPRHGHPRL